MATPTSTEFPPGRVLAGRYQVRRELGKGGMGLVYLCRDLVADERVALKVLMRASDETRKTEDAWWFQEEARALASLSHPAIVQARDFGTLEDGSPFLVMNVAPGRSLHEWIYLAKTDGLLPWHVTWFIVDQVLAGLAHAHARGVIHGDLKPSNVLLDLPPEGLPPTVRVLDLGLAWLLQDRVDHRLDGSKEQAPTVRYGAGTPGWMAPEQIRFATPHIGPPTDLYALGCILYALLTNREPFTGETPELLKQHRSAPVPEPTLASEVPPDVGAFVKKLLAKRPWHRFDFAADARRAWREFAPPERSSPMTPPFGSSAAVPSDSPTLSEPSEFFEIELNRELRTSPGLLGLRPCPFVARHTERADLMRSVIEIVERAKTPVHIPPGASLPPPPPKGGGAHQSLILLDGEAGVGKSRLADWLCEEVHERALMVPLRARYRKIAAPLDGVVGGVIQHYRLDRAERDVIERVLMNTWNVAKDDDDGLTWVAAAAEWIRPSAEGDPVGPTGKRFSLDRPEVRWLVIRKVLERIAERKPILLWMDDLHLAPQTTIEGILRIHQAAPYLPLLIIATARAEALEANPEANARLRHAVEAFDGRRLSLSPLENEELTSLLRETLPLDDAATTEAATRSKGNPLFALQILHGWALGGHLELRNGTYSVPAEALAARPTTTSEIWTERLQSLPDHLQPAARAAAALGGDIRIEVFEALLSALGFAPAVAIAELKRAQLLVAAAGQRLRWPHALLQEHLLDLLLASEDGARVCRAAADALGHHPASASRRVVRHRVVNLLRAGDTNEAANLLHGHIAALWGRTRDVRASLADLTLLDGHLEGPALAMHCRWKAEALRHSGALEAARQTADQARALFRQFGDEENEAHALRLSGHIASDLAAGSVGRRLVTRALQIFERLGQAHGRAQCEVTIGEIDYLLGDHARARSVLVSGAERFEATGDDLGLAQCFVLQALVEQAGGSGAKARHLIARARQAFDRIGYRLGLAQCDVILAHSDHRDGHLEDARRGALTARRSFRDLSNPRGEAACERLLAMVAIDAAELLLAEKHAHAASALYAVLTDPWGEVESRLLFAQICLSQGNLTDARAHLIACDAASLIEAEPTQHRHLTLAWLAQLEGKPNEAAKELELAKASFRDGARTGDHTTQLLDRLATMKWSRAAEQKLHAWRRTVAARSMQEVVATSGATLDA